MQQFTSTKQAFLYPRIEVIPTQLTIPANGIFNVDFTSTCNSRIIFELLASTTPLTNYYFRCIFMRLYSKDKIILQHNDPSESVTGMLALAISYNENGIVITNPNVEEVKINYKLDVLNNLIL